LRNKLKIFAYIIILVVFVFSGLFAQPEGEEIYTVVEEMAEFPGGIEAMKQYIANKTTYPNNRIKTDQLRKCFIKFVVNSNGSISDIQLLKGVPGCPECDKEAVRVIKIMPAWKPGKMSGRPVNVYYNLPVVFNLPVLAPAMPLSTEEVAKLKADAEAKAKAQAEAKHIAILKLAATNGTPCLKKDGSNNK
jgi:hypothetical protein